MTGKSYRNPPDQAHAHLESIEAVIRLEDEILGVLKWVNVAIFDNEVAQVLGLWEEESEMRELRTELLGRSSVWSLTLHPKSARVVPPS